MRVFSVCLLHLPEPAWGSAPLATPSCSYTILMLTIGSTHTTALLSSAALRRAPIFLRTLSEGNKKTLTPSWSPEKVVPITDAESLDQNYLKEFL